MALTKFDARKTYFDGLGNAITGCQTTENALKLSGLDYNVEPKEMFLQDGTIIPDKFANVRTDTNTILGVVGKDYRIVQNIDGFDFIDDLLGAGAKFETAGTFNNGRGAFMLAKTDSIKILGDDFAPYILFTNTFDGSGTIKVMLTPIRVVCNNAFILAEKQSQIKISIKHSKQAKDKLAAAKEILLANSKYLQHLKEESEKMARVSFTKNEYIQLVDELTKVDEDSSKIVQARAQVMKDDLMLAYQAPDLQKFEGTAYKALMSISDYESHRLPIRDTANNEIYMQRIMAGMVLLNEALKIINLKKGFYRG